MVVLMNGGLKTSSSAQSSPDLYPKFSEANRFAKAIDRALVDGDIRLSEDGRSIESDDGELILFY